MEMFSDLRQFDEAKKWADEYSRTRGDNAQVCGLQPHDTYAARTAL